MTTVWHARYILQKLAGLGLTLMINGTYVCVGNGNGMGGKV